MATFRRDLFLWTLGEWETPSKKPSRRCSSPLIHQICITCPCPNHMWKGNGTPLTDLNQLWLTSWVWCWDWYQPLLKYWPLAGSWKNVGGGAINTTCYSSGPQPFWHQGLVSWKTIFPRGWGAGNGSGGNVSDGSGSNASTGEPWGVADEASLRCPLLTSCCAARFLAGCGPVGDPCATVY